MGLRFFCEFGDAVKLMVCPYWYATIIQLIGDYKKAECSCSCKSACPNVWAPDQGEQRYCWGCGKWFNTSCLSSSACSQASVVVKQITLQAHQNNTATVVEVAFQPTARGGSTHFASGNGRIVLQARQILDGANPKCASMYAAHQVESELDVNFSEGAAWKAKTWLEIMRENMGLKEDCKGKDDREQLILRDQQMFTCSVCDNMVL